jgi:hypothetical protein
MAMCMLSTTYMCTSRYDYRYDLGTGRWESFQDLREAGKYWPDARCVWPCDTPAPLMPRVEESGVQSLEVTLVCVQDHAGAACRRLSGGGPGASDGVARGGRVA